MRSTENVTQVVPSFAEFWRLKRAAWKHCISCEIFFSDEEPREIARFVACERISESHVKRRRDMQISERMDPLTDTEIALMIYQEEVQSEILHLKLKLPDGQDDRRKYLVCSTYALRMKFTEDIIFLLRMLFRMACY